MSAGPDCVRAGTVIVYVPCNCIYIVDWIQESLKFGDSRYHINIVPPGRFIDELDQRPGTCKRIVIRIAAEVLASDYLYFIHTRS